MNLFEQKYEFYMSIQFFGVIMSSAQTLGVVTLLLPLFNWFFPHQYSPSSNMKHKNNGIIFKIFWFLDVFLQPLSVFASHGNIATIFSVFQLLLLSLFLLMAVISCPLIILNYNGTEAFNSVNTGNNWQKIALTHMESNTIAQIFPIMAIVMISMSTMLLYHQFMAIYVFFRQRLFQRKVPQKNYVMLIQNIPKQINTKQLLMQSLQPIVQGIREVVPIPPNCEKLTKLHKQYQGNQDDSEQIKLDLQLLLAQIEWHKGILRSPTIVNNEKEMKKQKKMKIQHQKQLDILTIKCFEKQQEIIDNEKEAREIRLKILNEIVDECVDHEYLFQVEGSPPPMPNVIQQAFDYIPDHEIEADEDDNHQRHLTVQEMIEYDSNQLQYNQLQQKIKIPSKSNENSKLIGASAFVICDSQAITAEKCSSLMSSNQQNPTVQIAPSPEDVVWECMGISLTVKSWKRGLFVILLFCLFIIYLLIETELQGYINYWLDIYQNTIQWSIDSLFFNTNSNFCNNLNQYVIWPLINYVINTVIMGQIINILPTLIEKIVSLLCLPSESQNRDVKFQIMFYFLISFMGIVQLVFTTDMYGRINFTQTVFTQRSISDFMQMLGKSSIFTLLNFIVMQYSSNSLLNIAYLGFGAIFQYLKLIFGFGQSFKMKESLQVDPFDYTQSLAYTGHILVLGFMYSIIEPIANVIVFCTALIMVICDRYSILYLSTLETESDLSGQTNLLVNVIQAVFVGLCMMLLLTVCYYLSIVGNGAAMPIIGCIVCLLCFFIVIALKIQIDRSLYRSQSELARGKFNYSETIAANPANENDSQTNRLGFKVLNQLQSPIMLPNEEKIEKEIGGKQCSGVAYAGNYRREGNRIYLGEKLVYKMNIADLLLEKTYVDLTKLPVSVTIGDEDARCELLNGEDQVGVQNVVEMDTEEDGEGQVVRNMMAMYTHPALVDVCNGEEWDMWTGAEAGAEKKDE